MFACLVYAFDVRFGLGRALFFDQDLLGSWALLSIDSVLYCLGQCCSFVELGLAAWLSFAFFLALSWLLQFVWGVGVCRAHVTGVERGDALGCGLYGDGGGDDSFVYFSDWLVDSAADLSAPRLAGSRGGSCRLFVAVAGDGGEACVEPDLAGADGIGARVLRTV